MNELKGEDIYGATLRIEFKGAFYHVTARCNERGNIYFSSADYEKFKDYLKDGQVKYGYRLHC